MLTFRDTSKEFELKGNLLKMITNKNYRVDLASLSDKKLMYNFAKEMNFDVKAQGKKSKWDRTLKKLLKSPGLIISASGISNTIFFWPDPYEVCNRLTLLLQEEQARNNFDTITEEIVAIFDKIIRIQMYIKKKQHKQILIKCNLLHTKKSKHNYSYSWYTPMSIVIRVN